MTLVEHALRGAVLTAGASCRLPVGLPWYRSMPVSAVLGIDLTIDGEAVPDLRLRVENRSIPVAELGRVEDLAWFLQDRAGLDWPAPAPSGAAVDVVLRVRLQLPNLVGPGGTAVQVLQEVRGTVPVETTPGETAVEVAP
ncbi:MAG TPA: hypothetical protein VFH64_02745 [Amnibacterium sp.]|nr:hypothetical protein [Amnibacterium sp.]